MNKIRVLLIFFCMLFLVQGLSAKAQEASTRQELDMLNLIRKEKFDLILPQAMRDNKVDMWIQVMRGGNPDPLRLDLGSDSGCFIFTDRGGDRIERAVLGQSSDTVRNCGAYDIIGSGEDWEKDLRKFVAERDPRRIAVNFSEHLAIADGISHTGYLKLVKALGKKYAKMLVSAEEVITDFRSKRVISEIVFYGQLCQKTVDIEERALSRIKPGVTSLKDVSLWLRDQNIARGFGSEIGFDMPGVYIRDSEGHESDWDNHIIRGGDLVHVCTPFQMMNYGTDIKRVGYVLRKGETALPPEIKKVFDNVLKARKILRDNIKVGRTGGETLEILKRKLEQAGYVYIDENEYNRNADPGKTQIHLDLHPIGNTWNGDVAVGTRISPLATPYRAHLKIPANFFLSLEYMIHMPLPKWGKSKHMYLQYEENVIVSEHGVKFLYPPMERIRLIH